MTVLEGKDNANCHQYIWSKFTDLLIKHISDNRNELVFLLWGAHAFSKSNLIDESRHKISVSSHPSGQSYSTTTSKFKAFRDVDHFGIANEYLTASNKIPINWQL